MLDGPAGRRRVLATGDGRFVFRDLAPGAYNVTARKSGHIEGAHGRRTPFGAARSVVLAEGERVADIDIAMSSPRSRDIPPGEYFVAAVDDVEQDEWFDPAFLQALVEAPIKVTIAEGEQETQDLRLASSR